MTGKILLCGNDVLLSTREMVLSKAGYITSICSENDIAAMPQNPAIALAVMGHSMPKDEQAKTAKLVRAKWPGVKTLFLTYDYGPLAKTARSDYEVGSMNPSHLVRSCQAILNDWV
jgi:DNA-binding NarL/FixJ family response regulator